MTWGRWFASSGVNCEECREEYGDEPTPCGECDKEELDPANNRIVHLWSIANQNGRDGANGRMLGGFVLDLCRAYGETVRTFESILAFEAATYPLLREREERERKNSANSDG
jgi:hypothetical protein